MIKRIIKNFLNKKGWINKNELSDSKFKFSQLHILLFCLHKEITTIIQIGANDGVWNDPINKFIETHDKKIIYLGFEPQINPFEKLKQNYSSFENFYFINECVGKECDFSFYILNQKFIDYCKKNNINTSYGINSLVKENLRKRIIKYHSNPDDYIDNYTVKVRPLKNAIETHYLENLNKFINLDLLQIDTEGYDDEVIYNSSIDFFKPKYINFESKNLTEIQLKNLINFLKKKNYRTIKWKTSDTLAVRLTQ